MKVAQAALQARLPRYFPWQFGVDFDVIGRGSPQDIFDSQLDVRDLLRSQDQTEWVIISTGMFMNYLFEPGSGMVDLPNDTVNALRDDARRHRRPDRGHPLRRTSHPQRDRLPRR
ncbi:hypothetical protein [Streptomyces misionensis]|uniref:hypothetical protein n=1 Tax=Streptomyces misionensis TaxID=67331 RepID=UPI0033AC37A4